MLQQCLHVCKICLKQSCLFAVYKLPASRLQAVHYQNLLKENYQKIKYFYHCELFLCYVYRLVQVAR